eukprot:GFUD01117211.1.p1 GENE.GFUD01117211.1~~GFUD01117211.1.p1  ORF type:complete len:545 (-),score=176.61 GFUD01117211.1:89-1723(-)
MDNEEVIEPQDEDGEGDIEGDNEEEIEIVADSVENSEDESDNNNLVPNGYHDDEVASSDDETDDEYEPLQPRIPLLPRIVLAGLGAVLGHNQRFDDSSSGDEEDNNDAAEDDVDRERFDSELPSRHTYLGEGTEVGGRLILDDELVQSLPLLSQPGMVLIPGQLLPLHLFHPSVISMMKKVIDTTKTFGVVNLTADTSSWRGVVGTTAEIFEYREAEDPEVREVGLKIKARGRQRFKLMSTRRQVDGNLVGEVKMLVDKEMDEPLDIVRIKSLDRFMELAGEHSTHMKESLEEVTEMSVYSALRSSSSTAPAAPQPTETSYPPKPRHKFNSCVLSPLPPWVWEMYSPICLMTKVKHELSKLSSLSLHLSSLPAGPSELSWWVAANLPLEDKLRTQLLAINSPVQRLRVELSFLSQCRVLVCKRCSKQLGDQQNIFSMSKEGPQGAFVNPGGHVHETMTLYKAKNLRLVGQPSTEYSWFPGYAWTITECLGCWNHIGWKFTAINPKLRPEKFYGFSRRSIEAKVEVPDQPDSEDAEEGDTSHIVM